MMDRRSLEIINRINRSIPKELSRNITRKEKDTSTSSMIDAALNNTKLDRGQRQKLESMREHVRSQEKEREVVNQHVTKEIDAYVSTKVAQAMKSGELKPLNDKFTRDMAHRTKPV